MNLESIDSRFTDLQNAHLREIDQLKRTHSIPIPTDDFIIKKCLRALCEPIILFGEDPYERRERFRRLINSRGRWSSEELESVNRIIKSPFPVRESHPDKALSAATTITIDKESYTLGTEELKDIRMEISKISLLRAKARLQIEKDLYSRPISQVYNERRAFYDKMKTTFNAVSQVAGDRPICSISFSSNNNESSSTVITGSWDGKLKIWDPTSCELLEAFPDKHEKTRICSIACNPVFSNVIASSDLEGRIILWQDKNAIQGLSGHTNRVSGLSFDPTGKFLSSSGYDMSWRLWDINSQKELQVQYGHSQPVQCISFHPDGALLATGSLDSFVRIWDIRTGRAIWTLQGHHVKGITSLDFSCNGFNIATGSEDDTIGIWDMRQLKCSYNLPAHTLVITKVKYSKNGLLLLSSSYDKSVKIWSVHEWTLLNTLERHDGKIMDMDVNNNNEICTAGYDRTFKIWSV